MSNGLEQRRMKEQLKILAGDRGAAEDRAQRLKDAQQLAVLLADLKNRTTALSADIDRAGDDLLRMVQEVQSEIPPVASSVSDILSVLNGGSAGQLYIKGGVALGGVWAAILGALSSGALTEITTGVGGVTIRQRDGRMVCYSPVLSAQPDTAEGALFTSAPVLWDFDVGFSSAPIVSICDVGDGSVWGTAYDASLGSARARLKSAVTHAMPVNFTMKAEGFH
jgi:hypothetical protein